VQAQWIDPFSPPELPVPPLLEDRWLTMKAKQSTPQYIAITTPSPFSTLLFSLYHHLTDPELK